MGKLATVQPLIESAKQAVGGINRGNIDELRSFVSPPDIVRHVLKAVLYIFGNRDESWNSMKTFVKTCVDKILTFDINSLKPDLAMDVEQIMRANPRSFEKLAIYNASSAAGPLSDWVKAVVEYCKVYQNVKPMHEELQKIEKELDYSRRKLKECS